MRPPLRFFLCTSLLYDIRSESAALFSAELFGFANPRAGNAERRGPNPSMPSGRTAEVPWPIRLGVLPKTVLGYYPNCEWGSTPIANGVLPQCKSGHCPKTSVCRLAKRQGSALNATRPRKKNPSSVDNDANSQKTRKFLPFRNGPLKEVFQF